MLSGKKEHVCHSVQVLMKAKGNIFWGKLTQHLMAIQMLFASLLFDKPQKEGAKRGYACTVERPTGHSNSISFAIPWWIS